IQCPRCHEVTHQFTPQLLPNYRFSTGGAEGLVVSGLRAILNRMNENNDVHTEFFDTYTRALIDRDAAAIADHYAVPALIEFPGQRISVTDASQTEIVFAGAFDQYEAVTEVDAAVSAIASTGHSIWADVTLRYHGRAPDERNMYQLEQTDDGWKIAVLTPLTLAESKLVYSSLLHTVIDAPAPRRSAEFYRQLLGYIYRPGDEPGAGADSVDPDWLVHTDTRGRRKLVFQRVVRLEPTTWPKPDVPMQLHLDFTVTDTGELARQRRRAEGLGAELIVDRSDDEDEPLYVFTDLDGHPFCFFVP